MKKINWREIFVRLTSRKFLLVLGGVIIAIAMEHSHCTGSRLLRCRRNSWHYQQKERI